ncbi:hypothetical protein K2X05_13455 [bacterium]|nr:hypothetical protein [bacterium]
MKYWNKRNIPIALLLMALATVGVLFQNATVVDFTAAPEKSRKLSPIERAIARADKEHIKRKKKMGVSDHQIHRRYLKRKRNPNAVIGDLPLPEAEKQSNNLKNNAR